MPLISKPSATLDNKILRPFAKAAEPLNRQIEDYLNVLDQSEQGEDDQVDAGVEAALKKLQARQSKLTTLSETMEDQGLSHVCETETGVKRMRSGREGIIAGYNIQTAVDNETGLIIHHEVTDESTDNRLLSRMTKAAQEELGVKEPTVLGDAGYSNGEQLAELEWGATGRAGIDGS